jgi:cyclopropane-fatty-acyl-phospholipid synthase
MPNIPTTIPPASSVSPPHPYVSAVSFPHQLFSGTTWHLRKQPARHKFAYPYRYWGVNITALVRGEALPEVPGWFSAQRKALQQFCVDDYLAQAAVEGDLQADSDLASYAESQSMPQLEMTVDGTAHSLLERLNTQFAALTGSMPTGEIIGLVVCRNLGVYFSPVNFYIGFDTEQTATHLLAEVSNTPWDKRHYYAFLLEGSKTEFSHNKNFHVSPFNPIDQQYRWVVNIKPNIVNAQTDKPNTNNHKASQTLDVSIGIHISDERGEVFAAGVKLAGEKMTDKAIKTALKANPIMNFTSVGQIYWHALKLFAVKRVPYVDYAAKLRVSKQNPQPQSAIPSTNTSPQAQQNTSPSTYPGPYPHLSQQQGQRMSMLSQTDSQPATATPATQEIASKVKSTVAAPTDRNADSKFVKITNKFSQSLRHSKVLKPIDAGINQAARKAVRQALSKLQFGQLTIIEDFAKHTTTTAFGQLSHEPSKSSSEVGNHPLKMTMTIHDSSVYRQLLFGGSIALADSYINGEWDTEDLTGLIRLAARNMKVVNNLDGRLAKVSNAFERAKHRLRSNDQVTAKSNIMAHYDLGNAMYERFLDPTMMYSSAVYPELNSTLAEAQQHKLKLICEQLDLSADDQVIEIGTGWGGFAIYAASHYGCHVTTTTISEAQYLEAEQRVKAAGLSDKITLLKQDYRELQGEFDKLVSIEMIEAVGHEYLPTFFTKCNSLLKPTGRMVMQAITFNDQGYEDYVQSVDFIQTHIFPGGCLLSNQEIIKGFTAQTDMVVKQLTDYGYDYAYTLRDWREAFFADEQAIRDLGYDESFMRLWRFYFCYCEGGFLERTIGVVQVSAVKPEAR